MLARGFLFTAAMPAVHYALLAGKIALIPVAFVLAIRTPGKPTPVDLMMLVYGLVMAVCCLINHTQLLTITLMALDIFIIWGLCRWFFVRQSVFPLKAVTLILLAFIALNFALLMLRPDGLWRYESSGKMYYLLGGNYNNMGKALFIAVVCNMLLLRMLPAGRSRERLFYRLVFVLLVLVSGATLWFIGSKTSLIGFLLVLGFGALTLVPSKVLRWVSMVVLIVVYFALQSWAVFRDQQEAAPKAEYFVEHVLKKDLTFSLRTRIWTASKKLIEQRPVIGYGEHDDKWYQAELEGLTTHNLVLHVLLKGGWVSLSVFIVLLLVVHLRLLRRYALHSSHALTSSSVHRDVGFIVLFSIWIYLFMMIFEVYPFNTLSILFIFASYLCYALRENPES